MSNLIVDQTSTNPAARAAAGLPVRTQGNEGVTPCTTDPEPLADPPVLADPPDCTPTGQTLFIPNVTTDVGLSPPYNSLFTLFGQFFDHGVDQTVKGGGTVFVPLKADDPLITVGPDHKANTGDEVPPRAGVHGADPRPEPARRGRDPRQRRTTSRTPRTPTRPGWTRARPTPPTRPTRPSCVSTTWWAASRSSTGKLLGGPAEADGHTSIGTWAARQGAGSHQAGAGARRHGRAQHPDARGRPVRQLHPGPERSAAVRLHDSGNWSRATCAEVTRHAGAGQRAALRHAVPDRHRAQRRPVAPGHRPQPRHAAGGPDQGRGQHGVGGLREPAPGHVRRRDAGRALRLW